MSKIKEILCLHHSHLDVGYTHPQNMLMELQCDYIDQVLDLCDKTSAFPEESQFRWTCEATYPVRKWFNTATETQKKRFRRLVSQGKISVAALPMHTTPGCNLPQMAQMMQDLDELREMTGSPIRCAINHDVNGQPWSIAPLLLDSGIRFYITGINIHFGGIPFPRPYAFRWQTPDHRVLPTFLGEHYSLFSQFFFTSDNDTAKMHQGIVEYVRRIEAGNWPYDFVYLTSTNPPLLDNNCPDAQLADLIRRYNEEGHEYTVRFVTPELLFERLCKAAGSIDALPLHGGDWTDYWNFGCASTARETKINRRAKILLQTADFLDCLCARPASARYRRARKKAWNQAVLFDEHTWGAAQSVQSPDCEETMAQELHKKCCAYTAAELGAYAVGSQMELAADNEVQATQKEGVLIANPTPYFIRQNVFLPAYLLPEDSSRTVAAQRIKEYLPYSREESPVFCGYADVPPCSVSKLPFHTLESQIPDCSVSDTEILTPYYRVELGKDGFIRQIFQRASQRALLDSQSPWGFFAPVVERIDPAAKPVRSTIFPRDVDLGNKSISQWQHDWQAVRTGCSETIGHEVVRETDGVTLIYRDRALDLEWIERRIHFSALHDRIQLQVSFKKQPVREPDGLYFAFPLLMDENWNCVYDTADTFVTLDREQLGHVCRDYITVDRCVSMFDEHGGITLACPDAPMIQVGGFQFGKENHAIRRTENPLLLAWPLNNYWDTNFAISQGGVETFRYELSAFSRFDAANARKYGILATDPCTMGSVLHCPQTDCRQLVLCSSPLEAIFFLPDPQSTGWIAGVQNLSDEPVSGTMESPAFACARFSHCTPQGRILEPLAMENGKACLSVGPRSVSYIHVEIL